MLDIMYAVFNRDGQGGISGNYHCSGLEKGKVMRLSGKVIIGRGEVCTKFSSNHMFGIYL